MEESRRPNGGVVGGRTRHRSIAHYDGVPLWVIGLCIVAITLFTFEATRFLLHPWFATNEPWQGLHIVAAARILDGATLYPDPFREASFYAYPPLLPWIHAFSLKIFGAGTFAVKVPAFIAGVLTLVGIYQLAVLVSGKRVAGLLAVAYYVSFFELLQFWHVSVRPDNIASTFVVWATIAGFRYQKSRRGLTLIVAGALLAAAALSKQTFGIIGVSFFGFFLFTGQGKKVLPALIVWVLSGIAVVGIYSSGDEFFLRFVEILARHELRSLGDILARMKWVLVLTVVPLGILVVNFKELGLLGWQTVGGLVMGLVGILKWGGEVNGFLTAVALASPLMVWSIRDGADRQTSRLVIFVIVLIVAISSFEAIGRLANWRSAHQDTITATARFIEKKSDSRVYYPRRNYLTYLASGQYYHCDWMSENLVRANLHLPDTLQNQVASKYFDYILGEFTTPAMRYLVSQYYEPTRDEDLGSEILWVPKPSGTLTE